MPLPGFHKINTSNWGSWGVEEVTYLHGSNLLLLTRHEVFDVNNATAFIGWTLVGPPTYTSAGDPTHGRIIYAVWDQYSNGKPSDRIADNLDGMFEGFYTNMQVPGMTQKDRIEDLGRVVGTAMVLLGSTMGSDNTSRIRTALDAGLSDEDALHYVAGREGKISRAGRRKLKKLAENSSEGVMLDPMLPGESPDDWEERRRRDMGDGAPRR